MEAREVGLQHRIGDEAWKVGIHCHGRVRFDELANDDHFLFGVFFPHIADYQFPFVIVRLRQRRKDRQRISEK